MGPSPKIRLEPDSHFSLLTREFYFPQGMYGLHDSISANIVEFSCFYLIQNVIPSVILITTRKRSPLRYLCIPWMIWIASRFIRPFSSSGSPMWCQAVTQLVVATLQATNLLLINPLDGLDISRAANNDLSFWCRLMGAVRLIAQTRAVNTPWQVKNVPSHPKYYDRRGLQVPSRGRFLIRQLSIAVWQYLVLDIVQTISLQQAIERGLPEPGSITIDWVVPARQWAERIATHLSIWFLVNRLIGDLAYRTLSIIFVGIVQDSPSDWPPAFGSMANLITIRTFWGRVMNIQRDYHSINTSYRSFWHQFMRQPFTAIGNFIARDVLNLTRSSILERYTNLFIVFLVSAIFHVMVDMFEERSNGGLRLDAILPSVRPGNHARGWRTSNSTGNPRRRQSCPLTSYHSGSVQLGCYGL